MTLTDQPTPNPATEPAVNPGTGHDAEPYQQFQRLGAHQASLLAEAERRARATGHVQEATTHLRRQVAIDEQRRHTGGCDAAAQRQAINRWSAELAAWEDRPIRPDPKAAAPRAQASPS